MAHAYSHATTESVELTDKWVQAETVAAGGGHKNNEDRAAIKLFKQDAPVFLSPQLQLNG